MKGLKLNPQIRLRLERKNAMQPLKTIATHASFLSEGVKVAPPPGEAVCVAQDVVLRHQRATAHVAAVLLETGHPWPHAGTAHRVSAHQPRVERRAATDHSWGAAGEQNDRWVSGAESTNTSSNIWKHITFTGQKKKCRHLILYLRDHDLIITRKEAVILRKDPVIMRSEFRNHKKRSRNYEIRISK